MYCFYCKSFFNFWLDNMSFLKANIVCTFYIVQRKKTYIFWKKKEIFKSILLFIVSKHKRLISLVSQKNVKVSRLLLISPRKNEVEELQTDPKTPDYQVGWAVLVASTLLDTLKRNFCFM